MEPKRTKTSKIPSGPVADDGAKKQRLRSSEKVYNQIKWSGQLPAEEFSIGYLDRFVGMVTRSLIGWCEDATDSKNHIPWHRVYWIKRNGQLVWDRESRLDRLQNIAAYLADPSPSPSPSPSPALSSPKASRPTKSQPAKSTSKPKQPALAAAEAPRPSGGFIQPYWEVLEAWRFAHNLSAWVVATPGDRIASASRTETAGPLSVATLNVLSDEHEAELTYTEARVPEMWRVLQELNPDVIGLQEVTRPLLQSLLNQDWVQARYHVSDSAAGLSLPAGQGQVLLSRHPFNAVSVYRFGPHKHYVAASIAAPCGPLRVGVCHLTSDHAPNADAKRRQQLDVVLETRPDILLGDFNVGDDSPLSFSLSLADAFRCLHPETPGFTFVPSANPLAAITTHSHVDRRLDRVLAGPDFTPLSASLFGDAPFFAAGNDTEPLFISDHFGLLVTLQPSVVASLASTSQ